MTTRLLRKTQRSRREESVICFCGVGNNGEIKKGRSLTMKCQKCGKVGARIRSKEVKKCQDLKDKRVTDVMTTRIICDDCQKK